MALAPTDLANFELFSNLQGNILKGHGRSNAAHIFIHCNEGKETAAKKWIKELAEKDHITTTQKQLRDNYLFKDNGIDGGIFASFYITAKGYQYLNHDVSVFEPAFQLGMAKADLNDPPQNEWETGYDEDIHFMLLLADADLNNVTNEVARLTPIIGSFAVITRVEIGKAMHNEDGAGIEHFGYVDGVSQPLFFEDEIDKYRKDHDIQKNTDIKFNPEATKELVLMPDPLVNNKPNAFGSYFVFRKLEQNVRAFKDAEKELAAALHLKDEDKERAGALLVGRFEDGTPVELNGKEGLIKSYLQNNFDYKKDDASKCPFHAHIRKSNPRSANPHETPAETKSHIMARRGMPFGERTDGPNDGLIENKPSGGVGLLFMSYQCSITNQFEFIQRNWVNNPSFPLKRPNDPPGISGLDPIIGQGERKDGGSYPLSWGGKKFQREGFEQFVTMKGGEYFFAPSITFLKSLA
jgi:Dyp-type peroxidase family